MGIWNRIKLLTSFALAIFAIPSETHAQRADGAAPLLSIAECKNLYSTLRSGTVSSLKAALLRMRPKTASAASYLLPFALQLIEKKRKSPLERVTMLIEFGATADKIPIGPNEVIKPCVDRNNKTTDYWRWQVLNSAIYSYVPGLFVLLRKACNFNESFEGRAHISSVVAFRNPKMLREFLKAGGDPNYLIANPSATTPLQPWGNTYQAKIALHEVAWMGWAEGAELLIQFGAKVNSSAAPPATPLHIAAMSPKGYLVIPLLLKHGADKNARNWLNKTPLQLAKEKHHERAIQLLSDN